MDSTLPFLVLLCFVNHHFSDVFNIRLGLLFYAYFFISAIDDDYIGVDRRVYPSRVDIQ